MRWNLGALLTAVILLSSLTLYSQSDDQELSPRNGLPANAFLKGCDKLTSTAVDFDGGGDSYRVEWWRCGPRAPNLKTGYFPVHYVVIRPPNNKPPMLGITLSNSGSSDEYFIDRLQLIDVPLSSRQLLLVSGRHYESGQSRVDCIVGRAADRWQCVPPPALRASALELRPHEKSFLRKIDEYLTE